MRRTCHKPAPCQSLPCTGVRALRGRNDIARLVSRSTRLRARAPPCCPCASNGLIRLVDACTHVQCAGMSRRTSAQLLSTCALDQTPAASACGVRGLQGHVPTVLRYWEWAMAGGGRDGDCVNYPHATAVPAHQQHTKVRLDRPRSSCCEHRSQHGSLQVHPVRGGRSIDQHEYPRVPSRVPPGTLSTRRSIHRSGHG